MGFPFGFLLTGGENRGKVSKVSAATYWNACLRELINTDFVWDFVKAVVSPFKLKYRSHAS